jgi:hypothetical protein
MVEYWSPDAPFELPETLDFEMKSQTDLYEFRKVNYKIIQKATTIQTQNLEKIRTHLPHIFT